MIKKDRYMISEKIINELLERLNFNEDGLIPAIAQDIHSKDVLMMAWMNKDSITATLLEGYAIYWSRSRQKLWRKGETSGHLSKLVSFRYDCDADTILLLIEQTGPACHTNRPNCFYNEVKENEIIILSEPLA